ncbi:uncharacterized protein BT62DRAFT_933786 [Guyanagaster necrorhizus]|uniref:Uncharacterized protein n=1 Tax=Guyanagaster necrorhizus TaxID=856835 RepID=A0A9P8AQV4_9AGAR|nr:uncharacterized protein BT62DRAFT_933786 [Guyanagaster necrorhizus MCA 3950]KAG7444738.1 hypothetical protein BT62DRAFT_933786 [Guyanagaster necrorhizus MCA 3950]
MVAYKAPENASPQMQAFTAYINAVAAFDSEGVSANLDDEAFEFNLLPQAMAISKLKKQEFVAFLQATIFGWFINSDFSVIVHEIIEAGDALTAHVQSDGVSKLGTPWNNEYILMLRFVPSKTPGELPKIGMYKEFLNSAFVRDFKTEEKKREAKE